MVTQIVSDFAVLIGIPVIRSVSGWLKNALEDNKITTFEWKLLASTVARVGSTGLVAYFGLTGIGFDVPAVAAASGAYIFDMILSALKKNKEVY